MAEDQIGETMTEAESLSVLADTGHGVLSLADDGRAYGVPISYALDAVGPQLVMEFVNIGDSKKQRFLEASREVTLTVHAFGDAETWASVIVTGALEPVDPESVSRRLAAQFFSQADDVAQDLRWIDETEIERRWYMLEPTEITGRCGDAMPRGERGLVHFSAYDRSY